MRFFLTKNHAKRTADFLYNMAITVKGFFALSKAIINWSKQQKVSPEQAAERMNICGGCDRLKMGICSSCGCVMGIKSKLVYDPVKTEEKGVLTKTVCPEGKW